MRDEEFLKLAEAFQTPAFVFDTAHLQERVKKIREIVGKTVRLCYSIKANPFVIREMSECVEHLEVCSPGELVICEKTGIDPKKIIFSGVNKTLADVRHAADVGVGIFTAESILHVELIQQTAKERNAVYPVLLRLNGGSQFGMSREDLLWVIQNRERFDGISIEGIHYFLGTQRKRLQEQKKELDLLQELYREIEESYGLSLKKMEYGPGLFVPYFEDEDFSDTLHPVKELAESLRQAGEKAELTVEMGRFFTAECGYYPTRVVDQKENKGTWYSIVDGGINHVNYLGNMMGMKVPVIRHLKQSDGQEEHIWTLCGSLCTTNDVLVRKKAFQGLEKGDLLVFCNIGAYSVTEGLALFLSRTLPAVILYHGEDDWILVRDHLESSVINTPTEQ